MQLTTHYRSERSVTAWTPKRQTLRWNAANMSDGLKMKRARLAAGHAKGDYWLASDLPAEV